jgi:PilZ domain
MNFVLVTKSAPPAAPERPASVPRSRLDAIKTRPAQPKTPENGRFATRKRVDSSGFISAADFTAAMRCVVRDTSSSGAMIEIPATADGRSIDADDIPDRFVLIFVGYRERTEVTCQVVRRTGRRIGVRYVGGFKTIDTTPPPRMMPGKKK